MATVAMMLTTSQRRSTGFATVRAWILHPALTTHTIRQHPRASLSSLAAARRKPPAYSRQDWEAAMAKRKLPPPSVLESTEEGYGAYDYQPELYETGSYDWIDGPPPDTTTTSRYPDDELVSQNPDIPEELLLTEAPELYDEIPVPRATAVSTTTNPSSQQYQTAKSKQPKLDQTTLPSKNDEPAKAESKDLSDTSQSFGFEAIMAEPAPRPPLPEPLSRRPAVRSPTTPPRYAHAAEAYNSVNDATQKFLTAAAARGGGVTEELDHLRDEQLPEIERQIYQENNGQEFNIKSTQQVSLVLYGVKGKSTNKDTLTGMAAAGNRMADLILQHRAVAATIKRLERKAANAAAGTHVSSVSTVARTVNTTRVEQNVTASETVLEAADPLLLLDASSFIFRAYHSMPPIRKY